MESSDWSLEESVVWVLTWNSFQSIIGFVFRKDFHYKSYTAMTFVSINVEIDITFASNIYENSSLYLFNVHILLANIEWKGHEQGGHQLILSRS